MVEEKGGGDRGVVRRLLVDKLWGTASTGIPLIRYVNHSGVE